MAIHLAMVPTPSQQPGHGAATAPSTRFPLHLSHVQPAATIQFPELVAVSMSEGSDISIRVE